MINASESTPAHAAQRCAPGTCQVIRFFENMFANRPKISKRGKIQGGKLQASKLQPGRLPTRSRVPFKGDRWSVCLLCVLFGVSTMCS